MQASSQTLNMLKAEPEKGLKHSKQPGNRSGRNSSAKPAGKKAAGKEKAVLPAATAAQACEDLPQSSFYYIAHQIPGRMRLRPLPPQAANSGRQTIASSDLAVLLRGLPPNVQVDICPKTGSILIAVRRERQAATPERRQEPRNPVPGKILSYVYPKGLRFFLAVARSVPYMLRGLNTIIRKHSVNLDVLDGSALLVCLLQRDFRSLGSIVFFFALGEYLAEWTRKKSHASLADSLALNIESAWIQTEAGEELEVPLARLNIGDIVIIRAGSVIPVDGTVAMGDGMVNQATMTGEALPVHRKAGNSVYAGTILEEGELRVQASKVGGETRINSILRHIEESEEAKAAIQGKYEKIADAVVPYNFMLCGLVYALTRNPRRAGSVLLVDYSCAIRLSTPLAILTAMQEAADHGVLIKGGKFAEALAQADVVVFDKTGTLTEAQPTVADVISFSPGHSKDDILKLAACLEEHFPHPVGRAVVRAAEQAGLSHREEHAEVEFVVAHGIASKLNGQRVLVGSEHFLVEDSNVLITEEQRQIIRTESARGRSILYLSLNGGLAGILMIEDKIRPNAREVISKLRESGVKRAIMLTGDGPLTAAAIAAEAGIDEFRAAMLPEQKAAFVSELREQGFTVLMIGDGVNDSPALSAANIGCAMCSGADMAKEVADMVLTSGNLDGLLLARDICRKLLPRISSSFRTSLFWNSLFLLGGLTGLLSAGVSAFLHNTVTSAIAVNSMRPYLEALPAPEGPAAKRH